MQFGGLSCRLIYFFSDGKLARAKFLFNPQRGELNESPTITPVEPLLLEKYGKPGTERVVWDNPAFQTESHSYLERDRSIRSEIMPSDKFAGLEIALESLHPVDRARDHHPSRAYRREPPHYTSNRIPACRGEAGKSLAS